MPDHEFFKLVLPQGEITDETWQELIRRRQYTVGRWMDKCTLQTLGHAVFFRMDKEEYHLDRCLGTRKIEITGAQGYSLNTQGVYRPLCKLSPGELERIPNFERYRLPHHLLGFTRDRKWIVVKAEMHWHGYTFDVQGVTVNEMDVDQVVKDYSIDYRRIWEFLGDTITSLYERKQEELRSLQRDAEEVLGEKQFVLALYGCVPLWW